MPVRSYGATDAAAVAPKDAQSTASALSLCLLRYLRWLSALQHSIDAVSDDAYVLDRLVLQGVLPLRQRSMPPTPVQAGLRAALYELLMQVPTPGLHANVVKRTPAVFARSESSVESSHTPTHSDSPPCPCRAFVMQQELKAREEARQSRSARWDSSSSSSSSSINSSDEGDEEAPFTSNSFGSSRRVSPSASPDGSPASACLAATASFPTRLRESVRGVQRGETASTGHASLNAPTQALPDLSSPRGGLTSTFRSHLHVVAAASAATTSAPMLLPVTVATETPLPPLNEEADTNAASPPFSSHPFILVDAKSQPSRTLHALYSHLAPEDVRRCSLCSAQLLLESCWHGLYLLELLTVLSAAPAMAAPLPLPPPSVLRVHPVEAFLMLFQTAQRLFVSGVTLTAVVAVTTSSPRASSSQTSGYGDAPGTRGVATRTRNSDNDAAAFASPSPAPDALAVLRGNAGTLAAAGAASLTSGVPRVNPLFPSSTSMTAAAFTQQEERLVSALAQKLLHVVDTLGGNAGPLLWPRPSKKLNATVALSFENHTTSMVERTGNALALQFRAFHVLLRHDGAAQGLALLADVAADVVWQTRSLHGQPDQTAVAPMTEEEVAAEVEVDIEGTAENGGPTNAADGGNAASNNEDTHSAWPSLLTALRSKKIVCDLTLAMGQLSVLRRLPEHASNESLAALHDDSLAFCCVLALLTTFADLVDARDTQSSAALPATPADAAVSSHARCLSDAATHLLDKVVYPALLELQNSSRGSCSAQARQLLALWWLVRAETVRYWVHSFTDADGAAVAPTSLSVNAEVSDDPNASSQKSRPSIHVLDVEVTRREAFVSGVHDKSVVHWSKWLPDASRSAVRESNAAREFLGLSFTTVSTTAAASSLRPSWEPSLRWRLPAEVRPSGTKSTEEGGALACLPLPWVRMWLQLCPLLFHISPADVLAVRQLIASVPALPSFSKKEEAFANAVNPEKEAKGSVPQARRPQPAAPKSPVTHGRGSKSTNIRRVSPQPSVNATRTQEKRSPATKPAVANAATASGEADTNAEAEKTPPSVSPQHRLRNGTDPVSFWMRWSALFLLSLPQTPQAADVDISSLSPAATALTDAVELLRRPLSVFVPLSTERTTADTATDTDSRSGTPSRASCTQLVHLLHHAFPLLRPSDTVRALEEQCRRFVALTDLVVPRKEYEKAPTTTPRNSNTPPLFASYSFLALVPAVRRAVERGSPSSGVEAMKALAGVVSPAGEVAENPTWQDEVRAAPTQPPASQQQQQQKGVKRASLKAALAPPPAVSAPSPPKSDTQD